MTRVSRLVSADAAKHWVNEVWSRGDSRCCSAVQSQPLEFCLSAGLGSLLVVAVAVLRIYLGWAYVGDRLLSAAVRGPLDDS